MALSDGDPYTTSVQTGGEDVIPEVEGVLTAILGELQPEDRPAVERYIALIRKLIAPEAEFSVDDFIIHEVSDEMHD